MIFCCLLELCFRCPTWFLVSVMLVNHSMSRPLFTCIHWLQLWCHLVLESRRFINITVNKSRNQRQFMITSKMVEIFSGYYSLLINIWKSIDLSIFFRWANILIIDFVYVEWYSQNILLNITIYWYYNLFIQSCLGWTFSRNKSRTTE